jgi:hypothetical protein
MDELKVMLNQENIIQDLDIHQVNLLNINKPETQFN